MVATDSLTAADVRWRLDDLYLSADDPSLQRDLDEALRRARVFAERYRGRVDVPGGPSAELLKGALDELAAILETGDKPQIYAHLLHAADARPARHGALVAWTQERGTEIRNALHFFHLEWLALPDEQARQVIEAPACALYRHFLEASRRYRPHVLSEPEELLLEEKANTGERAFSRLFDDLLASLRFEVEVDGERQTLNESGVLALLSDGRRSVRCAAAASLTAGLKENELVITAIFNTLVQDHAVDDRLRSYAEPMQSRHLANEIDAAAVERLMDACEEEVGMVSEYYLLKARLLGLERIDDYDRYAPLSDEPPEIPWEGCRETVLAAYADFSPRMAEIASEFFERSWIDAELRDGKRGGAFSASTVPSAHPYVLVNYTGRARDVMTVAHELGHGVHQYLSRPQGYLQADTPLTTAETASVFGEMLVFDRLRRQQSDPRRRLALLCQKLEESFATVFRQIALTRFEQSLHGARRAEGELSAERIGELWMEANHRMYGEGVRLTADYRRWWSYISHFVHSPFYCYAYGFGELLVLALYDAYRREGTSFVSRYLELLSAGGSDSPSALLRRTGIDIEAPDFWRRGLRLLRGFLDEAIDLARQLG